MIKTKKKFAFYSNEEIAFMNTLVDLPRYSPFTTPKVIDFCKKYNRSLSAVQMWVSKQRRLRADKSLSNDKTINNFSVLKRNEFIIPVTNWEIRSENGVTNLVLKFK